MVNGFNDTLKATGSSGVSINRAYRQMLMNTAQSDSASEINTLGGYGAYGSTNNIGNNYLASLFSSRFNFWQ